MNALTLLKTDHKTVEELFKKVEALGENSPKAKRKLVDQIIRELSIHAAIEEQVFYPAVREAIEDAEDNVLESLEEHHVVKWLLSELDGMDPMHERFDAKVTVLMEAVRHHVKEEEEELFPKVREVLKRGRLDVLGEEMEAAKRVVPAKPRPRAPDTPPGNLDMNLGKGLGKGKGMATTKGKGMTRSGSSMSRGARA